MTEDAPSRSSPAPVAGPSRSSIRNHSGTMKKELPPPSSPSEPPATEVDEDEDHAESKPGEDPDDEGEDEVEEEEEATATKKSVFMPLLSNDTDSTIASKWL